MVSFLFLFELFLTGRKTKQKHPIYLNEIIWNKLICFIYFLILMKNKSFFFFNDSFSVK